MKRKVTCSVVGARGYAGLETARLLLKHPVANLTHCFATSSFELTKYLNTNAAKAVKCLVDTELLKTVEAEKTDVVFLATPAEVSLHLAPKLMALGAKVIDLSGAFRLKTNDYSKWYGFEHTEKAALAQAEYGLVPFVGPASGAKLVANPGCYATAIALALIPLVKAGLIDETSVVIDAKSGATGAGKKAAENLLYTEVEGECLPYKVGKHQHYPEISEAVAAFAGGAQLEAHMSTHLLPTRRGIIAGVYARLHSGKTEADVVAALTQAYADYPLVTFGKMASEPQLVSLKKVVGTGQTHISFVLEGQKLYVFSCIDNLMKGAASQAIENFNRLTDVPVQTGLETLEAVV